MRVRIAYDGQKYWVEQKRWLGYWQKCCSVNYRSTRFYCNPKMFETLKDANDFALEWLRTFCRGSNSCTVHTGVTPIKGVNGL